MRACTTRLKKLTFAKVIVEHIRIIRYGANANARLNTIFVGRTVRIFYAFLLATRTPAVRIPGVVRRTRTLVRSRFVDAFSAITARVYFLFALVHVYWVRFATTLMIFNLT